MWHWRNYIKWHVQANLLFFFFCGDYLGFSVSKNSTNLAGSSRRKFTQSCRCDYRKISILGGLILKIQSVYIVTFKNLVDLSAMRRPTKKSQKQMLEKTLKVSFLWGLKWLFEDHFSRCALAFFFLIWKFNHHVLRALQGWNLVGTSTMNSPPAPSPQKASRSHAWKKIREVYSFGWSGHFRDILLEMSTLLFVCLKIQSPYNTFHLATWHLVGVSIVSRSLKKSLNNSCSNRQWRSAILVCRGHFRVIFTISGDPLKKKRLSKGYQIWTKCTRQTGVMSNRKIVVLPLHVGTAQHIICWLTLKILLLNV